MSSRLGNGGEAEEGYLIFSANNKSVLAKKNRAQMELTQFFAEGNKCLLFRSRLL